MKKNGKRSLIRKKIRVNFMRVSAAVLTVSILGCSAARPAWAGPPSIDTDEAVYVNLDYYGAKTQTSIVKGCSLNGLRSFTDYGTYRDVTNMSNHAAPQITEEGVTWNLPEDVKERFYYECQLDNDSIVLPWDFDISYKLNGVPVEAQTLAGADGLVEIDVKCTPNEAAKDYYKNNMLLQVAAIVSMEDVNSIVAAGSQTQSLGTYKVILFAAVPGETASFHMEIGTSDFELPGIFMMMIPGTLEQMKEIKDIKEVKDTFSDSAEELMDSLNDVLDKLDGFTSGIESTQAGLKELKEAKAKFDASKDALTAGTDQGLAELSGLSAVLNEIAPDIGNVHETIKEISDEMDHLAAVAQDSEEDFSDLGGRLGGLKDHLRDFQDELTQTGSVSQEKLDKLQSQMDAVQEKLNQIMGMLEGAGDMSQEEMAQLLGAMKNQTLALTKNLEPYIGKEQADALAKELSDAIDAAAGAGGEMPDMGALLELVETYSQAVEQVQQVIFDLQDFLYSHTTDGAISSGASVLNELDRVSADLENAMAEVGNIHTIKKQNQGDFDKILEDTRAASQSLANASGSLSSTLGILQDTLKANRANVENGTEKTLDGLIDIMEKAVETSNTNRMKDANQSMKDSVKSEIDKVEEETNFLKLDAEEEMISFTSDKNDTPSSIQVILKTQEISKDSAEDHSEDIEPEVENRGVWYRIRQVFVKIWEGIKGIFRS